MWGKASASCGYSMVPQENRAVSSSLTAGSHPWGAWVTPLTLGTRAEGVGPTQTHRLNNLAESTDVNAGGRPETDVPSSRGEKPGRRRRCHSSRRPGEPATRRRAPGARRPGVATSPSRHEVAEIR